MRWAFLLCVGVTIQACDSHRNESSCSRAAFVIELELDPAHDPDIYEFAVSGGSFSESCEIEMPVTLEVPGETLEGECSHGNEHASISAYRPGSAANCVGDEDRGRECMPSSPSSNDEIEYILTIYGEHENISVVARRDGDVVGDLSLRPTYVENKEGCIVATTIFDLNTP